MGGNYTDCGLLLYDIQNQDMHAGASGCGCAASVLCGYLLGRWSGADGGGSSSPPPGPCSPPPPPARGEHPLHLSRGGHRKRLKGAEFMYAIPQRVSLRRPPMCHRPDLHRQDHAHPCPDPDGVMWSAACSWNALSQSVYGYIAQWGGAGASVPLTGFGSNLAKGGGQGRGGAGVAGGPHRGPHRRLRRHRRGGAVSPSWRR